MLKPRKILLLWIFLTMVVFLACNDAVGPEEHIIISEPVFVKYGYGLLPRDYDEGFCGLIEDEMTEYKFGDTMAIRCKFYSGPNFDVQQIQVRVSSSKTGDVQYINCVHYPWYNAYMLLEWYTIAYISPVKYDTEIDSITPDPTKPLLPDLTKKELIIDPNGDILTAEIKYKKQTFEISITVKGD